MNHLPQAPVAAMVAAVLGLLSGTAHGLGYGPASSRALLGEPLFMTVPVRAEAGEQVMPECVAAEVHFGDQIVPAEAVQATLLTAAPYEHSVRVRTTRLINEPIVTVQVSAGCNARITRKFVVLADPPDFVAPAAQAQAPTAATAAATGAQAPRGEAPAAATASTQPAKTQAASQSSARPGPRVAQATPEMPKPRAKKTATASTAAKSVTAMTPAIEAPRLVLDPVAAEALAVPQLMVSHQLSGLPANGDEVADPQVQARRQAAAALWRALNATPEEMAREQQRLDSLEQRLHALQNTTEVAQKQVTELQARVRQAEGRAALPAWVYALGFIAFAAMGTAGYLFWRLRRQEAAQSGWWAAAQDSSLGDSAASMAPSELSHMSGYDSAPPSEHFLDSELLAPIPPAPPLPDNVAQALADVDPEPAPASAANPTPDPAPVPVRIDLLRTVSVEELIDLEQQAEFFLVLGQDEAAVELLEAHIQGDAASSPLPYLKLLEIYQQMGLRADYERVQADFRARFQGDAPAWGADLSAGRTVQDYPGMVDRLQALWHDPGEAMAVLERALTHAEPDASTYDLPAYRELLLLYAVARDLFERSGERAKPVDLLHVGIPAATPVASASDSLLDILTVPPEPAAPPPVTIDLPISPEPARPRVTLDLELDIEPPTTQV